MKWIVVVVLLCSSFAIAGDKNKPDWKTGKLLSFNREGWTSHGGSTTTGQIDPYGNVHATTQQSSWNHDTYYVAVDDGEFTYFAERTLSFRWQHDLSSPKTRTSSGSSKRTTLLSLTSAARSS